MQLPKALKNKIDAELARRELIFLAKFLIPNFEITPFHQTYYSILQLFTEGKIKKLMISVPPQHGKTEGSTKILPCKLFGLNPNLKIAIASYAATLARSFNRQIQRYIDTEEYSLVYPKTKINSKRVVTVESWLRNSDEFEIVDFKGSLKSIGRGGGLTGNPVDIMILDDVYKDFAEANSPVIRESAWDWYINVIKTRLHNNSQELIVFTRWHEDDLIGRIAKIEQVIEINSLSEIENIPQGAWVKINFQAIKENEPTELDLRIKGEVLWENKHNLFSLLEVKSLDINRFECLYQGNPQSREGQLYDEFKIYSKLPEIIIKKSNYTDTADTGTDYLCSICYVIDKLGDIYIADILYTQEPMEVTEGSTANLLIRNGTKEANIESNNGGRGFARQVEKLVRGCVIRWFHQSENKESRILTNSATVNKFIIMPEDWKLRFKEFYQHISTYKRIFSANKFHDCADVLTGIIEKEKLKPSRAVPTTPRSTLSGRNIRGYNS
jgi:predicted phage terminase large subunit-like protein